jgi:hypothetical protein
MLLGQFHISREATLHLGKALLGTLPLEPCHSVLFAFARSWPQTMTLLPMPPPAAGIIEIYHQSDPSYLLF